MRVNWKLFCPGLCLTQVDLYASWALVTIQKCHSNGPGATGLRAAGRARGTAALPSRPPGASVSPLLPPDVILTRTRAVVGQKQDNGWNSLYNCKSRAGYENNDYSSLWDCLLSHLFLPAFLRLPLPPRPRPEPAPARFPRRRRSESPAGPPLFSAKITAPEHLLAMRPTETLPAHPAGAKPLIKLYSLCLSVIQMGWDEASWN